MRAANFLRKPSSWYFFWATLLFCLCLWAITGCTQKIKPPVKTKLKKQIERQEINGVLIVRKNFYGRPQKEPRSEYKILRDLKKELADDPLTKDLEVNYTLSYARLTVAGEACSASQVNKLIDLALRVPEIKEVVSTIIVTGDNEERALL
jgi:hypothetical protein